MKRPENKKPFQIGTTMECCIDHYWRLRLETCKKALEKNDFEVFLAQDANHAKKIILEEILPGLSVRSVSWGDSMTLISTDVLDIFRTNPEVHFVETFDDSLSREERYERRRQALLVDLFFTGTNALTLSGQLVNLDMVGNRVGGITFGPRHVVITVGRNKIVTDLQQAMDRIKQYAAPINALRHSFKTPCTETGHCTDCTSPDRICNVWTITERSFPKGRIKIILINKDLGL